LPGRFGFRKPPTAAYSSYLPTGIPTFNMPLNAYTGGLFYDGRATDTSDQAQKPFLNPNEMNNVVHDVGSPDQVVYKVRFGPSGDLFRSVYGQLVFNKPVAAVYALISQSIAAFEASPEVAPFTSKYDAWLEGKANLTPDELEGLRLVTGYVNGRRSGVPNKYNAHCAECHGILADSAKGPDLWTFSCYANLGVPKNPDNPYYRMTDAATDPTGYNALGSNYIDYGLGDFLYPLEGKASGDLAENDPLGIDGTFKTPTLRNVDARPYQGFVKCYMHNGVFKSLQQVVHFYNTRNLTTYPGEVIDFTKPNPYANLKGKPLWPAPEWASPLTMINPQGLPNKENDDKGMDNEQIGNMNMTPTMEAQIVAFLKTLTDGYFTRD
jgi:cytochrome c peroxidase